MSAVTVQLLEALLSPAAEQRRPAEEYLKAMTGADRCGAFLQAMSTIQQPHLQQMIAVLLRRDILKMQHTQISILPDMVDPLLVSFVSNGTGTGNGTGTDSSSRRTSVGDCLAEICAVLSVLAPSECSPVLQKILQAIGTSASQADLPSLRLLVSLADRAPRAFCESSALQSLPQLLTAALSASSSSASNTATGAIVQVLTHLVVTAAIATTLLDDNAAVLAALAGPRSRDDSSNLHSRASVDVDSAAAQLGRTCLPTLVPCWLQMMTAATTSASASGVETLHATMEHVIQAANHAPSLLAGDAAVLQAVAETCLQTASQLLSSSSTDNGSGYCHDDQRLCCLSAVQVVSSICAVGDVKRKIVHESLRNAILQGNQSSNIKGAIPLCLELVVAGTDSDCEGWASDPATLNDDGVGWEGDEIALYAESLLESLLHTFGSHALQVVLPLVEQLLASSSNSGNGNGNGDFKLPRAGLVALQCCLVATPVSFAPHMSVALEAALSLFANSSNARVQFQAILLLGVLCESGAHKDEIREQYGARLWQTLAQAAQSSCTKIAAMACLSMVSYCRGDPSDKTEVDGQRFVVPYLSNVLQPLVAGPLSLELVHSGAVVVKVRAVGAVACLAQASGPEFVAYYADIMPGLLACAQLSSGGNYEVSRLKGAAIEAATIVGQAIGEDHRDVFLNDAEQIMQWAVPVLSHASAADAAGMPLDQLLSTCARIASVMGEDYAPFLDAVLPHLLRRATDEADVSITEGNEAGLEATKLEELEMDEDAGTESMTVAVPGRGLTKVTINTTKIQEKAQAARGVYEHAVALGAEFGPYSKSCLDEFLLLVRFKYSAEIRATAAQTLAAVFEAACQYGETGTMELPATYLSMIARSIAKQIQDEDSSDSEVVYALADSLSEVYYSVYCRLEDYGPSLLRKFSLGDAKTVVQLCMQSMVSCLGRRENITRILSGTEGALTGEDEREEYEGLLRSEEALLTPLVDSVGYSLKFLKQDFVPIFESHVAPILGPYLRDGSDIRARLSAVCLYDDCVEHCGASAAGKFAPMLIGGVMLGLDESTNGQDNELKQASIYGVAQMARHAPSEVLAPHLQSILSHLVSLTTVRKEDSENCAIFENSVSALASLLLIGNAPFKSTRFVEHDTVLNTFLAALPLREDEDEAKFCHAGLCDMVESASLNIDTRYMELVRIIGETLAFVSDSEDIASPNTCTRFAFLLFQMQQQIRPDRMQQSFASLSPDAQAEITSIMTEHAHQFAGVVTP